MDPKKLNILLGIVIVVLLALVGYMAYVQKPETEIIPLETINRNTNTSEKENNNDAVDTLTSANATLKTYTNAKYGFEFQYPKEWEVYVNEYGQTNFDKRGVVVVVGTKENIAFHKTPTEGTEGAPSYFRVASYEPKTVTAAMKDCVESPAPEGLKVSTFYIAGLLLNKCVYPSMFGTGMSIIISEDNKLFHRVGSDLYEGTTKTDVDKILSTFKLIY